MTDVDLFLGRMNRLKSVLGLSKDKEIAAALGLSDKALNARKTRNSFPEKELRALADKQPALAIDVSYVLTGKRSQANVMAALSTAGSRVRLVRGVRQIAEFAKLLGVEPAYLEQVESAGQWMSNELLTRIVEHENISPMWLMSGELPVLEGDLSPMEISLIDNYRNSGLTQQAALRGHAANLRAQTISSMPLAPEAASVKAIKPRMKRS